MKMVGSTIMIISCIFSLEKCVTRIVCVFLNYLYVVLFSSILCVKSFASSELVDGVLLS